MITAPGSSQHALRAFVLDAPVAAAMFDDRLRYTVVNDRLSELNGLSAAAHVGRTVEEVAPAFASLLRPRLQRVLDERVTEEVEADGHAPGRPDLGRRTWRATLYPLVVGDQVVGVGALLEDVTARRRAERRSAFLAEASRVIAASLEWSDTVEALARVAVPAFADWCLVDILEGERVERVAAVHRDPAGATLVEAMKRHPPDLRRDVGIARVLRTGELVHVKDLPPDRLSPDAPGGPPVSVTEPEALAQLRALGVRSYLSVPLAARGERLGALTVASTSPGRWDDEEVDLIADLARRAALAVSDARLYRDARAALAERDAALARVRFLTAASEALERSLDLQATLDAAVRAAIPTLADYGFVDRLEPDGGFRRQGCAHRDPILERVLAESVDEIVGPAPPSAPILEAIAAGAPRLARFETQAERDALATSPAHLRLLQRLTPRSVLILPLRARGRTLGALTLTYSSSGRRHDAADVELGQELALRCALALDAAALLDQARRSEQRLRDALEATRRSEARARRIFESNMLGVGFGEGMRFSEVNDAFCEIVGYSREELASLDFQVERLTPPEWHAQDRRVHAEFLRTGVAAPFEKEYLRKDGRRVPVLVGAAALQPDEPGEWVCFALDLSGRKQVEREREALNAELSRKVQELEALFDVVPVGIGVSQDPDCRRITSNPYLARLLGVGAGENASLTAPGAERAGYEVYQAGRLLAGEELPMQRAARGEVVGEAMCELRVPGRSPVMLMSQAVPLLDASGRPAGAVGAFLDVTRQRALETARAVLADAGARLSESLEPDEVLRAIARVPIPGVADMTAVVALDDGGAIAATELADVDPAGRALLEELARRFPLRRDAPSGVGLVLRTGTPELVTDVPLSEQMAGFEPERQELIRRIGTRSYVAVPLRARGRIVGALALMRRAGRPAFAAEDLPLAEELAARAAVALDNARLYAALREADQRKTEFLAMLAHELRNPLAPIRTAAELVSARAGRDAAELARHGQVIERQVAHMSRLLDDLLDVSRVSRGAISLRREVVDLRQILERGVESCRTMLDEREHRLELALPERPVLVDADPARLEQVLVNLLTNAARYTDPGGRISVALTHDEVSARVRVADTGIGIAPEFLPRLFELFSQADPSLDRGRGGLGIGLTLVRSLMELHGGTVEARSEGPGRGSEFVVTLPLVARGEAPSAPASVVVSQAPRGDEPLRVLVVDDNEDGAAMLAELLDLWGHAARVARTGTEALAAAAEAPPDVVLLDIGLPELDGYEVARRLRASPGGDRLTLVALTGYGTVDDRRRAREAGFDRHFTKPLAIDPLEAFLDEVRARRRTGGEP